MKTQKKQNFKKSKSDKELKKLWKKKTEKQKKKFIQKLMAEELNPYNELFSCKKDKDDFINENFDKVLLRIKAKI